MRGYPEAVAVKTWKFEDVECYLVLQSSGYYCGYVRFPTRPVQEEDYEGILTYVPVHGGITYASNQAEEGMVYGFDCAHSGDEYNTTMLDTEWLTAECEAMARAIKVAAVYEQEYLNAKGDNKRCAEILDSYQETLGRDLDVSDNFGAMINLMTGRL